MNRWRGCGWAALGLPLLVLVALPLAALVWRSVPSEVLSQLSSEEARSAILVSLRTTCASLILLLAFGTPLAYALGKGRFPGRRLIEAFLSLPAVLPPSVAGIALLLAFGRSGTIGPFLTGLGIQLPFTAGAVVLAQVFVAVPFFLRPAVSAFRSNDPAFAEAAELDGAAPPAILWRIELPLSLRALGAAATLAWARALGEFGATILFAGSRLGVTRTMPLAIYLGFETDLSQATALSSLLLGVAVLVLLLGLLWSRRTPRLIDRI